MFAAIKRATLLFPSGPSHHLLVVLNDPFGSAQQVLMVPACSIQQKGFDETCILHPGDHDFIAHDSYIAYRHCRIEPASRLINGVSTGEFIDKGLMQEAIFNRILMGLQKSPFTKPFAASFLKETQQTKKT